MDVKFICRSDLESVLTTIFENVFDNKLSEDHYSSSQDIVRIFLESANFSSGVEGHDEKSMSLADLRSWFAVLPSARKFLGSLLVRHDPGYLHLIQFTCRYVCPLNYDFMSVQPVTFKCLQKETAFLLFDWPVVY